MTEATTKPAAKKAAPKKPAAKKLTPVEEQQKVVEEILAMSVERQEAILEGLAAMPKGPMIFPAMLAILQDVDPIPKGQRNQQQGYAFRGIDDVMNALHPLFAKHGVFVAPGVSGKEYGESTSRSGTKMTDAYLTLSYRFYAADGSYVDAEVAGESRDAADKATNQASSSAFKYLLLQMFVIPLEGTKESDHESPEAVATPKEAAPEEEHPDVRAKKAVLLAAKGDKEKAGEVWDALIKSLKIELSSDGFVQSNAEADLIIHQIRSYIPADS